MDEKRWKVREDRKIRDLNSGRSSSDAATATALLTAAPDGARQAASNRAEAHGEVATATRSERLLRFPMVQARIPYSHSTIYLLIKLGKFPKPVSLGGRAVAWKESSINEWIDSRT